jgi:hypothetical protein
MSTLHHTPPDRHRISARPGTALALTALIANRTRASDPHANWSPHKRADHGQHRTNIFARPPPSRPKPRLPRAASATPRPTLSAVPTRHQLRPRPPLRRATSAIPPRTSSCASPPHGAPQDNIRRTILAAASFRKNGVEQRRGSNPGAPPPPAPTQRCSRGAHDRLSPSRCVSTRYRS